jgi:hypothetical protein
VNAAGAGGDETQLPEGNLRSMVRALGLLVLVQSLHAVEHVAQAFQRVVLHEPAPRGLLGRWFDFEWMHFAFNVTLGAALLVMFLGYRMHRAGWRRAAPVGWWAFVGALAVEDGLHVPEHVVRVYELIRYGWEPAPGILGHTAAHGTGPFDLLWLHTTYNLVVTTLVVTCLVAYRRALGASGSGRPVRSAERRLARVRAWEIPAVLVILPMLAIVAATCAKSPPPPPPNQNIQGANSGMPQCSPEAGHLRLVAADLQYHSEHNAGPIACLAAPAGRPFDIVFVNRDQGVLHDVHVLRGPRMYSHNSPNLFRGRYIRGRATATYHVGALPPGVWSFHCDLHPDSMNGLFVVPVSVGDGGFTPSPVDVMQGFAMAWFLPPSDAAGHRVVDGSGVFGGPGGSFDSGTLRPGGSFFFRFTAAGTYTVADAATARSAEVVVPVVVSETSGPVGAPFTIQWAFDRLPHGLVADVQVQRPGSAGWVTWRTGQAANSGRFVPDAGPGAYAFRARLRRDPGGQATGWSPPATIVVG